MFLLFHLSHVFSFSHKVLGLLKGDAAGDYALCPIGTDAAGLLLG